MGRLQLKSNYTTPSKRSKSFQGSEFQRTGEKRTSPNVGELDQSMTNSNSKNKRPKFALPEDTIKMPGFMIGEDPF